MRVARDGEDRGFAGRRRCDRLAHVADEVATLHELHREADVVLVVRDELVELYEIRMAHVGQRPEFLLESVESLSVDVAQRLDCDALLALTIVCFVNAAHPAFTERAEDFVASRALPSA